MAVLMSGRLGGVGEMKKAVSDTPYKHVILRDDGVPTIAGTRMRVEILVLEHHEYGWSPAELQFQHPHTSPWGRYTRLLHTTGIIKTKWTRRSKRDSSRLISSGG